MNSNQAIVSLKKSCINSIESSIDATSNLLENLKVYKQAMVNSFDQCMTTEKKNSLVTPYPHLPGIITSFPEIIKSGSDMQQNEANKEELLQHKRVFWRLIENDYQLLLRSFKQLKSSDVSYEEFLEILNGNINLNIQPQKTDNKASTIKPTIKLTVDPSFKK